MRESSLKGRLSTVDLLEQLNNLLIFYHSKQSDQKGSKKSPNFSKCSLKRIQVNKGQNIYNKAQFEWPKHPHQTAFETLKYLQQTMF
jgi:hypothetical protein